jgi:hypothetical protein
LCSSTEIAIVRQSEQMRTSPAVLVPAIRRFPKPQNEQLSPGSLRNLIAHGVQIDTPGPLATQSRSILQKVQITTSSPERCRPQRGFTIT